MSRRVYLYWEGSSEFRRDWTLAILKTWLFLESSQSLTNKEENADGLEESTEALDGEIAKIKSDMTKFQDKYDCLDDKLKELQEQ